MIQKYVPEDRYGGGNLDRGYQTQPYRGENFGPPASYDSRMDEACCAVPVEEPLTSQITNRLDQALKDVDQLIAAVNMRADSLFGPSLEKERMIGNEKSPPPMLDRGVMDRINRQTREVLRALEALEYQFRRFNQL